MINVKESIGFLWDKGNFDKNWLKHKVTNQECEEVFFDQNKKTYKDQLPSAKEKRFILLGKTKAKRFLYVVFTIRKKRVRIISARVINRKEVKFYGKTT